MVYVNNQEIAWDCQTLHEENLTEYLYMVFTFIHPPPEITQIVF